MNKKGIALMCGSHIVDDFYQGAVTALIPFLVLQWHYNYAQAAGIMLASTVLSSVAQPAFGILTDKKRLPWLVWAGPTIAGIGVGLCGITDNYVLTWLAVALSGLGIAAFHPEATRTARYISRGSQIGMSWFSIGGNIGFALGPVVVTPILLLTGVGGTPFLIIPAVIMCVVLMMALPFLVRDSNLGAQHRKNNLTTTRDDWRSFTKLTGLLIFRSILFFGLNSFLALYITHELGMSNEVGQLALFIFLASGIAGTMLGGWLGDRYGRLQTIRLGYICALPALAGFILAGQPLVFIFISLLSISLYIPFSVQVTLGQDYLPTRIGTASGVTLGIAVSVGGLFAPLLGLLADSTSLRLTLALLIVLPLFALAIAFRLKEPQPKQARREAIKIPPDNEAVAITSKAE